MNNSFKKIIGKIIPIWISTPLRIFKKINIDYAHWKTTFLQQSINRTGAPIPWYSYPAVEYIEQLNFSDKSVFEYGSGNSTIFWANRCRELTSVEHDPQWYHKIQPKLHSSKVDYKLITDPKTYTESIHAANQLFDVIIIDGKQRYACATAARKRLAPGGMIILDNADWFAKTAEYLRDSGLIEIDMSGFGPINHYTWTTSFFLSHDFNIKSIHGRQPSHSIAAIKHIEDEFSEIKAQRI